MNQLITPDKWYNAEGHDVNNSINIHLLPVKVISIVFVPGIATKELKVASSSESDSKMQYVFLGTMTMNLAFPFLW